MHAGISGKEARLYTENEVGQQLQSAPNRHGWCISAPLLTVSRRFCPAVVAWGEVETSEFKRQSRAFAARLAADAMSCTSLEVTGRNHFDVIFELGNPASPLFAAARALYVTAPRS